MPPHERMFRHEHAEKLDDVERHRWLPPDDVIGRLAVQAGMRVADIGAGTGYFTLPIARAVGSLGNRFRRGRPTRDASTSYVRSWRRRSPSNSWPARRGEPPWGTGASISPFSRTSGTRSTNGRPRSWSSRGLLGPEDASRFSTGGRTWSRLQGRQLLTGSLRPRSSGR